MLSLLLATFMACNTNSAAAKKAEEMCSMYKNGNAEVACKIGVGFAHSGNGQDRAKWYCRNYRKKVPASYASSCEDGVDFFFEKVSAYDNEAGDSALAYSSQSRESVENEVSISTEGYVEESLSSQTQEI